MLIAYLKRIQRARQRTPVIVQLHSLGRRPSALNSQALFVVQTYNAVQVSAPVDFVLQTPITSTVQPTLTVNSPITSVRVVSA